jgi:hypothetical protein
MLHLLKVVPHRGAGDGELDAALSQACFAHLIDSDYREPQSEAVLSPAHAEGMCRT